MSGWIRAPVVLFSCRVALFCNEENVCWAVNPIWSCKECVYWYSGRVQNNALRLIILCNVRQLFYLVLNTLNIFCYAHLILWNVSYLIFVTLQNWKCQWSRPTWLSKLTILHHKPKEWRYVWYRKTSLCAVYDAFLEQRSNLKLICLCHCLQCQSLVDMAVQFFCII